MITSFTTVEIRQLLVLLLPALLLVSCEEVVELELGERDPQLVVSSNFFPETPIRVDVSATQSVVGEVSRHVRIVDARVVIFEANRMIEELAYQPELQRYVSQEFTPETGKEYTIHVSADGFTPVSAVSSIPERVAITSLIVEEIVPEIEMPALYDFYLLLDFDDPEGTNYYDLRIRQTVIPYELAYNGDTILKTPFFKAPSRDGRSGAESISLLLQDKPLASEPVLLRLRSEIDPRKELFGDVVVELRTVSPEYYKFRRSLIQEQQQPGGGISQPVLLFNNISDGGIGIFAGYNRDVASVAVRP